MKNTENLIRQLCADGILQNAAIRVGRFDTVLGEVYTPHLDENTLFDMASVTKILSVTTLSLIAIDKGVLKLTDKVSTFFPVSPQYKDLTVFHLLTHTMGVGHRNLTACNGYDTVAEYILTLEGNGIGKQVEYSCPAFILMGKILETVYGKRLDLLFKEMVAVPLKMERSGFCPAAVSNMVNSNLADVQMGQVNDYNCRYLGGVAGNAGVFSCIADMTKFVQLLFRDGNPLFSKAVFDLARENHTKGMNAARGIGFVYVDETYTQTGDLFPVGSIGHCGHTGQSIFLNRENGVYAIILTDATVSSVKKYGEERYETVMNMRKDIHNAIKNDLTGVE